MKSTNSNPIRKNSPNILVEILIRQHLNILILGKKIQPPEIKKIWFLMALDISTLSMLKANTLLWKAIF